MFEAFFQHVDFDASMTVNVTLMLCLVTLFTSMLNSLPKTSSVKMIDVWVVFNLMVPFFEIILQTLLYKLGNEVNARDEDHILHGKTLENPKEQLKSESSDDKAQTKDTHDDQYNEEKGEDAGKELERQIKKLAKNASGRYLLVNTIKYVLPGVYTLFCFIFFLIGAFLAESKQII